MVMPRVTPVRITRQDGNVYTTPDTRVTRPNVPAISPALMAWENEVYVGTADNHGDPCGGAPSPY